MLFRKNAFIPMAHWLSLDWRGYRGEVTAFRGADDSEDRKVAIEGWVVAFEFVLIRGIRVKGLFRTMSLLRSLGYHRVNSTTMSRLRRWFGSWSFSRACGLGIWSFGNGGEKVRARQESRPTLFKDEGRRQNEEVGRGGRIRLPVPGALLGRLARTLAPPCHCAGGAGTFRCARRWDFLAGSTIMTLTS